MFDFIKKYLFGEQKSVEQTGFIPVAPSPTDYIADGDPSLGAEELLNTGDWRLYMPEGERQSIPFTFDTMSCVTFSFLNSLEGQVARLIELDRISPRAKAFLYDNGYMGSSGSVNFSDRFTAIMSGTLRSGNTFPAVAQSGRKHGLIPEKVLPFGDSKSFEQYHDLGNIKPYMVNLGQEFLKYFEIGYEWILIGISSRTLTSGDVATIQENLKQAPLQIGVPFASHHAIVLTGMRGARDWDNFDSYDPFFNAKNWNHEIRYVFKPVIVPKEEEHFTFTQTLKMGSRGFQVQKLQEHLSIKPFDGIFGKLTHAGVVRFQKAEGLVPDGIVGKNTRAVLNEEIGEVESYAPTIEQFADAIQEMEGYFPGSRAYKNNNPFNLKYIGQRTAIGKDDKGFCIFPSYDIGRQTGIDMIKNVVAGKSRVYKQNCSILEFFKLYAPDSDGNDSNRYASFVAQKLKVGTNYKIKDLIF